MRLSRLSPTLILAASLAWLAACSSGGSTPPTDGGPIPPDGGRQDGGIPFDGGPLPDAGIPCNQRSIGPETCGISGGLECLHGQICVANTCSPSPTTRPGPRSDHSLGFDPARNRVLLFGGDSRGTVNGVDQPVHLDETWAFDSATQRWERLNPSVAPEARGGAATTRAGVLWYLFGGRSGAFGTLRLHNDVWSYDLTTDQWSQLSPDIPKSSNANVPDQRYHGRVAADPARNRLLIFGGTSDAERFGNRVHNDLWSFDLTQRTWQLVPPSSPWPAPRQSFAADVDDQNGRWYLFGGARGEQIFNDEIWRFNLPSNTWEVFNTSGSPPQPEFARFGAELAYVPVEDRFYMFGGHDLTALGPRNDLWRFEINTRAWMRVNPGDAQLRAPNCAAPERREEHSLVYIQAQRRLLLFGGQTACGLVDDLWYFNLDGATWSNPYVATKGESCERVLLACFGPCPEG
jgi:hypothetical protein